jgi:hypothetical protein
LFDIEPTTQPLFRNSIKAQGRALVKMIHAAVTVRILLASLSEVASWLGAPN